MSKRLTTEGFVEKAQLIFPELDYSNVVYINNHTKIKLICAEHGEFYQSPNSLLQGHGCSKCGHIKGGKQKQKTLNYYLKKFKQVHDNFYDYSKVNYVDCKTEVCIICPIHGEFWQSPYTHSKGHGCCKCAMDRTISKTKLSEETVQKTIKEQSIKNHYKYRPFKYSNARQLIECTCLNCGNNWSQTYNHLSRGRGCFKCAIKATTDSYRYTTEEVLKKIKPYAERNLYEVVSVEEYKNSITSNILCKCKKCGKEFKISLGNAQHNNACPYHNNSKLENYIRFVLTEKNINFEEQKTFNWLGRQRLDFYLPDYNIAIECQGEQHFNETTNWKIFNFKRTCDLDILKYNLCKSHNIKILYFTFEENNPPIDYIDKIFVNIDELIKAIQLF